MTAESSGRLSIASQSAVRVGGWIVHPKLNRMVGPDGEVQIEPRLMGVLVCLAEARGEVISRNDLLDLVWGDVIVGEEALTRAVSELRRVLGDDPQNPVYIETIRKGGYRLLSAVELLASPAGAGPAFTETTPAQGKVRRSGPVRIGVAFVVVALALSVVWFGTRQGPRANSESVRESPLQTMPVTSYPGRETTPSLSPDGTALAFAWTGPDDGEMDLYVKQIGEESPLRLTDVPGADVYPVWSKDGRSLYYIHREPGSQSIMQIPLLGGEPREILKARLHISGFTLVDEKTLIYSDAETHHGPGHLYRRALETGAEEQITEAPGQAWDYIPMMGPDGVTLAFVRRENDWRINFYLLDLNTRDLRKLTNGLDSVEGMCWDRAGKSLVFASRVNGNYTMWRVWVADGAISWIPLHGEWMFFPTVACNADRMVYQHRRFEKNIWRVSLGDDPALGLSTEPVITSSRWDCEAYYSPDGKHLAFISSRSGNLEVWACQADGARPVQLTHFEGPSVGSPSWSPEGSRIALAASPDGFQRHFHRRLCRPQLAARDRGKSPRFEPHLVCGWPLDLLQFQSRRGLAYLEGARQRGFGSRTGTYDGGTLPAGPRVG